MYDAFIHVASLKNATIPILIDVNKVIRRLKTEKVTLKFQCIQKTSKLVIIIDGTLGNLQDEDTQSGHIFFLTFVLTF